MKLSELSKSAFTPHPETEGPIKAVLVDLTELKERQTQYGIKEEFRMVFETECMDDDNDRRFCIWSRGYTPSLNEKAALRKDLKKLMGRELTKAELDEFDMESIIGMGVKLIIQHEHVGDKVYANISFMAPDKDKALKPSGKYTRIKDRDGKETPKPTADDEVVETTTQACDWQTVVVHVGKFKGKKLGDVDEAGVKTLIDKWLPNAKGGDDQPLADALTELKGILSGDDY